MNYFLSSLLVGAMLSGGASLASHFKHSSNVNVNKDSRNSVSLTADTKIDSQTNAKAATKFYKKSTGRIFLDNSTKADSEIKANVNSDSKTNSNSSVSGSNNTNGNVNSESNSNSHVSGSASVDAGANVNVGSGVSLSGDSSALVRLNSSI